MLCTYNLCFAREPQSAALLANPTCIAVAYEIPTIPGRELTYSVPTSLSHCFLGSLKFRQLTHSFLSHSSLQLLPRRGFCRWWLKSCARNPVDCRQLSYALSEFSSLAFSNWHRISFCALMFSAPWPAFLDVSRNCLSDRIRCH